VSASDFVTLRGGLVLPVAAIRLALDLENRGLTPQPSAVPSLSAGQLQGDGHPTRS
jgi:hypothetical protein